MGLGGYSAHRHECNITEALVQVCFMPPYNLNTASLEWFNMKVVFNLMCALNKLYVLTFTDTFLIKLLGYVILLTSL